MKTYQQFDKLGRELLVDDCVAYVSFYNGLTLGRVVKVNPARVRIIRIVDVDRITSPEDIQPRDVILLDSKDVSFYLLKN